MPLLLGVTISVMKICEDLQLHQNAYEGRQLYVFPLSLTNLLLNVSSKSFIELFFISKY